MADTKFKQVISSKLTLAQKIEDLLDDIFVHFGLTRNEVNIEIENISESDEDY